MYEISVLDLLTKIKTVVGIVRSTGRCCGLDNIFNAFFHYMLLLLMQLVLSNWINS